MVLDRIKGDLDDMPNALEGIGSGRTDRRGTRGRCGEFLTEGLALIAG